MCLPHAREWLASSIALALALSLVLDPAAEGFNEQLAKHCGLAGPDVVFECAGIPSTIDQAANLVRRGGTVALVGLASVPAEISPMTWLAREVSMIASLGYLHDEFDYAMQLIADGRLRVVPLHTDTIGLEGLDAAIRKRAIWIRRQRGDHPPDRRRIERREYSRRDWLQPRIPSQFRGVSGNSSLFVRALWGREARPGDLD